MIDFERVEDALRMLKKQESLALEDVLGVYLDLCEALVSGGRTIDSLPIVQTDKLLKNLSRSGRTFLNIIRKHGDEIQTVDIDGRIRKQKEKLSESIERISEQEERLRTSMEGMDAIIEEAQKKRQAYETRLQIEKEKRSQLGALEEQCRQLSEEVDRISSVSLEPLQKEKQRLEAQKKHLEQQTEEKRAELEQQKAELRLREDELQAEIRELTEERDAQKRRCDQERAELTVRLNQKKSELTEHEAVIAGLNEEIQARADAIHERQEKKLEMEGTVAFLKEEQNKLNGNVVILQNEIDRLSEHLKNNDATKLVEERDRLRQEKLEADTRFAQEQSIIHEQRAALQEKTNELQAVRDRFEKEKSSLMDQNIQTESRIRVLKEAIDKYSGDKLQMEKDLRAAEGMHDSLEQWFESLEVQKYRDRLKLIEEKIYLFKEVQAALFAETGAFGLNQGMTHKEANEKREELRQQMETLETMTENYRKRYNMICGLFSDK